MALLPVFIPVLGERQFLALCYDYTFWHKSLLIAVCELANKAGEMIELGFKGILIYSLANTNHSIFSLLDLNVKLD